MRNSECGIRNFDRSQELEMERISFTVNESTVDALDRLQGALRDLITSLEASKNNAECGVRNAESDTAAEKQAPAELMQKQQAKATTLEEVRGVLCAKAQEGKTALVKMLLERFGVTRLTDADPADYAEILEEGRRL